jgi:hypothetical protein
MAAVLSPGGAIYLEVPRADYIAEHTALFDFYYPHVQYFREDSLERLVARAGLAIERRWLPKNGHDMGLLLQGATPRPVNASAKAGPDADGLCVRLSRRLDEVRRAVAALPGRVGMYGATWQGVAFLRACDDARPIAAAFDDSAAMAGCALYGPSQSVSIAQPSYAALRGLDVVIITAYLHDAVIAEKLRAMQFAGRILTIRPDGESPSLARAW